MPSPNLTVADGNETILVVDDNEMNRDMLSRRLVRQGYPVEVARNGREALHLLQTRRFDLILLDIMMPELTGYEVLEHLKAAPNLRDIPVIMISALSSLDSIVRCIELGADDYLTKPFNPTILNARVKTYLEKKRLRDQEQAYLQALEHELTLGRQIQADFLPDAMPQPLGWEIAVSFQPAFEVAGDFYDGFLLPENRLGFVIADVCGKGVGAALFMTLIRSLIRAFAEQTATTTADVLNALSLTNTYIIRHHRHKRRYTFATVFFGVLNLTSGELTYINAGHYPPIIIQPNGTKKILEMSGPAVGLGENITFASHKLYLEPGDGLVAYTDGVSEARNAEGNFFSDEAVIDCLQPPIASATDILKQIETQLLHHLGSSATFDDDVTMLALRRLPKAKD